MVEEILFGHEPVDAQSDLSDGSGEDQGAGARTRSRGESNVCNVLNAGIARSQGKERPVVVRGCAGMNNVRDDACDGAGDGDWEGASRGACLIGVGNGDVVRGGARGSGGGEEQSQPSAVGVAVSRGACQGLGGGYIHTDTGPVALHIDKCECARNARGRGGPCGHVEQVLDFCGDVPPMADAEARAVSGSVPSESGARGGVGGWKS